MVLVFIFFTIFYYFLLFFMFLLSFYYLFIISIIIREIIKLTTKVIIVPVITNNEVADCQNIISNFMKNESIDIFVSGKLHIQNLKSRITHPKLLSYVQNDKGYTIDYFKIDSCKESIDYFENIKYYNIIFLHTKATDKELFLLNIIDKYSNVQDTIIICANKNVYESTHNKYELANKYVNLLVPIILI